MLAFVADVQMPGQGMATLAAAIVGVIVVNGVFSFWQEYRAEETMAALQRLLPHQVRVQREGVVVAIPSEGVVPGDVILLSAGDNVPADCRLLEAFGVRVNNATVTGEARAVSRDAAVSTTPTCCEAAMSCWPAPRSTTGEAKALRLRDRHAHRVRWHRASHTDHARRAVAAAEGDRRPQPAHRHSGAGAWASASFVVGVFIGLPMRVSLVFSIGIIVANVPGGIAADGDSGDGHGGAADGEAANAGASPAERRDTRFGDGHLHGQNRHADAEPDGCSRALRA